MSNLTNLKDLEYICEVAWLWFSSHQEPGWAERALRYKRIFTETIQRQQEAGHAAAADTKKLLDEFF